MRGAVVIMCLLPHSRWAPQAALVIHQVSAHERMPLSHSARALQGGETLVVGFRGEDVGLLFVVV